MSLPARALRPAEVDGLSMHIAAEWRIGVAAAYSGNATAYPAKARQFSRGFESVRKSVRAEL